MMLPVVADVLLIRKVAKSNRWVWTDRVTDGAAAKDQVGLALVIVMDWKGFRGEQGQLQVVTVAIRW